MPTPANRVPVRVARGNKATLDASLDKLFEGEIVYALDEATLYAVDNAALVPVAGSSVTSVNGQTGTIVLGVGDLDDVLAGNVQDGDMLVYASGSWITTPATSGGTVISIDIEGTDDISATGGPITSTGTIQIALEPTGVTAGEYTYPTISVDDKGRVTAITGNPLPPLGLDDLTNVDAPIPAPGDVLAWNGLAWVPDATAGGGGTSDVEFLSDLEDVNIDTVPADGEALVWSPQQQAWIAGAPNIEFPEVDLGLGDLNNTDIDAANLEDGDVIAWDTASSTWKDTAVQPKTVSSIQDVDLTGLENNYAIIWDQQNQKWVAGLPGAEGRIIQERRTGTTADQPLHGPPRPMTNTEALNQGWLGINTPIVANDYAKVISSEDIQDAACFTQPDQSYMFRGKYIQSGREPGSYNQAPRFGKGEEITFVNGDTEYRWNRIILSISHAFSIGWTSSTNSPDYSEPFDPKVSTWPGADFEVTIFPQEADDRTMRMGQCYVQKRVTWEGQDWTIFRREMYANNDNSRNWITETWISENLDMRVLTTTDYEVITQPNPFPNSQGMYQGLSEDDMFDGVPNNAGEWENLTTTGDYAITLQELYLPPEKPEYSIKELTDVNITDPASSGEVLSYDPATESWVNQYVSLNNNTLSELGDVVLPGPVQNQVLLFNGAVWVAGDAPLQPQLDLNTKSIDDLGDVDSSSAANGQYLQWNGSNWVPVNLPSGIDLGSESIDGLADVDTSTEPATEGQALIWDGSNWVPGEVQTEPVDVPESISDLDDVDTITGAPQDGESLIYDAAHSKWVPGPPRATQGAPTQTSFPGIPGEMRFDLEKLYVCVAPNTWKEVQLSAIGGGSGPEPEIGEIVDGGNFTTGAAGTIDTVLDGGDFTSGLSGDLQDHVADGGVITPGTGGDTPGPDDAVDGGDFTDGTSDGGEFLMDGGNFTTGQAGSEDITIDGGLITGDGPGPDPTPGPDDTVDGGDFGQGGDTGTDFTMDGGNFTTGAPGTDGTLDGGDFSDGAPSGPGADDPVDGGDFTDGSGGGTDFTMDGGNFTTGGSGTDGTLDGGDFSDDGIDNTPANGGDFTTGEPGTVDEVVDGGNFSQTQAGDGGNFSTGQGGDVDEVIDGGNFTTG